MRFEPRAHDLTVRPHTPSHPTRSSDGKLKAQRGQESLQGLHSTLGPGLLGEKLDVAGRAEARVARVKVNNSSLFA